MFSKKDYFFNKLSIGVSDRDFISIKNLKEIDIDDNIHAKHSFVDLFRNGTLMARNSLICAFLWFTATLSYYGLSLGSASLPGSIYFTNSIYGLVEIPSYIIAGFVIDADWMGRKRLLSISYFISGACTLIGTGIAESTFCRPKELSDSLILTGFIFSSLGKFGIGMAFAVVYNYTSELFPTKMRNSAMGFSSTVARIGGMLSPVIIMLYNKVSWLPGMVFGTLGVLAAIVTLLLPETNNVPMLMTISDANRLYANGGFFKKKNKGKENLAFQN